MSDQNRQPGVTRVQRVIAYILSALFIIAIFGFGIYGLVSQPDALVKSLRFSHSRKYLADDENFDFFEMTRARILSLQNQLGDVLPFEEPMGVINASFQFGLGKDLTVQGAEQMMKLPNDQLYYITQCESLADEAQDIVDLYHAIDGRIPFLFSYVHPAFFNGGLQLPAGYDVIDTSDELADQVLGIVRAAGIEALDSRTFFENTGLTNEELELKTDKHWTARAALLATPIYAEKINELTNANLDLSRLQIDQFEAEYYPGLFFGDFGRQIGLRNSAVDDITIYTPKYPTQITRHSELRTGEIQDVSGEFAQSVLRRERLNVDETGLSADAYTAYGLIEAFEELTNEGPCEDMTILVLRDSYSEPICGFLSLAAKHVISADLRYCKLSGMELIEKYNPDIVVVSYSRLMLESRAYDLGLED